MIVDVTIVVCVQCQCTWPALMLDSSERKVAYVIWSPPPTDVHFFPTDAGAYPTAFSQKTIGRPAENILSNVILVIPLPFKPGLLKPCAQHPVFFCLADDSRKAWEACVKRIARHHLDMDDQQGRPVLRTSTTQPIAAQL